jgi:hypothetical protein
MSWGQDTTGTPIRRSMTCALLAPVLAGLVWASLNLLAIWIHLNDAAKADDLGVFVLGVGVVVYGAIGFVVVLIPTLLGLWARDDVSRLGSATFTALVAALGAGIWGWGAFGSSDAEPGVLVAARLSALVLLVPAGTVVWAWRDWAHGR